MATTVFLVRHGATDWNIYKRAQGHADIELNAEGHRHAVSSAQELSHLEIGAVYSSDLKRAIATATPIATPARIQRPFIVPLLLSPLPSKMGVKGR